MLIEHRDEACRFTEKMGADYRRNVRLDALPALLQEYLQAPTLGVALSQVYSERGFAVVEKPRVSVKERLECVRAALQKYTAPARFNSPWRS